MKYSLLVLHKQPLCTFQGNNLSIYSHINRNTYCRKQLLYKSDISVGKMVGAMVQCHHTLVNIMVDTMDFASRYRGSIIICTAVPPWLIPWCLLDATLDGYQSLADI